MNLNKARCPLSGNKLFLIPTDVSLLPNRVKKDSCNNQYYIISGKRLRSYTSAPQTNYKYPALGYVYVKLFTSNFVPTSKVDNLIEPCINIKALKKGCNFLFMHKSNVFETEIDNNKFHVYLVNNDKGFDFHICEKNSAYKHIITLLSNKMNNNE